MNRLLHQLRGHQVRVAWRVKESGSGWQYTCECGKAWA